VGLTVAWRNGSSRAEFFDADIEVALVATDQFQFVFAGERDGMAAGTHTAGASRAVDVVVRTRWQIDVENVGDALDVQSSGGNIGGDEYSELSASESVECFLPLKFT